MTRKDWFNVLLIACTGLVVIFTGVYLFTCYSRTYTIDLSSSGTIGDPVNGLSAPIISFFSALLIHVTFKEQNKANKMQI